MRIWHWLTHLGVTAEHSPLEAKRLIQFNQVVLVSIVSVEFSVPMILLGILPLPGLLPLQFAFLVMAIAILVLMWSSRVRAAKTVGLIGSPLWYAAVSIIGGPDSGLQFLWALLLVAPYLILGPNERTLFWLGNLELFSALGFVLFWFANYPPLQGVPPEYGRSVYYYHVANVGFLLFFFVLYIRRSGNRAEELLEIEQAKSDSLLLNVLPPAVAVELKENGAARPVRFDRVSVLFTDFQGFTAISERMAPETVIQELDVYFSAFDEIAHRHGLEKIKTIGDAYMAAGGIPRPNESNAVDCVLAARDLMDYMEKREREARAAGRDFWRLRLGIHTGPLVAGVVGRSKFAYDVFGDTVNVASRMESAGEAGRINVSKATRDLVHDFFECESRGHLPIKNRGEMEMFFVNGPRAEANVDRLYARRFAGRQSAAQSENSST